MKKLKLNVIGIIIMVILLIASVVFALVSIAAAQTPPSQPQPTSGISVSPGIIAMSVSSDTPAQATVVSITNNFDTSVSIDAELRKIDENAGLLVPTGPIDESLSKSLTISDTEIVIAPKTKREITVTFQNLDTLSPGGHYATLLLTQVADTNNQLSIRSAVSVNIFASKKDGERQSLKVQAFKAPSWLFKRPTSASLDFVNEGNVYLTPRASVQLLDRHGNSLANGVANQGSQPLFPGKTLHSDVKLVKSDSVLYPQKLTVLALYRADGQTESQPILQSFWYIPPFFAASIIALIALPILLLLNRKRLPKIIRFVPRARKKSSKMINSTAKSIPVRHDEESSNVSVRSKK